MKEQLVSFETAKLAKEKGFEESCEKLWANYYSGEPLNKWKLIDEVSDITGIAFMEWKAPTQALLQRWLREEHSLDIEIRKWSIGYCFLLFVDYDPIGDESTGNKTYEEALEKGLFEALKLIK